jgi:hypothetical protein
MYSKAFIVIDALDECSEENSTRADLLGAAWSLQGTKRLPVRADDHAMQQDVEQRPASGIGAGILVIQ